MVSTRRKAKKAATAPAACIDEMVERIVRRFDPQRILLFGSHARGDTGPDSDVDLLIAMPVAGSAREKAIEIGVALHDIRLPTNRL